MNGKIAIEEHFELSHFKSDGPLSFGKVVRPDYFEEMLWRLPDRDERLREMDRGGIECSVLSLTQPGVQAELDPTNAIQLARRANEELYERFVRTGQGRFAGFAAVPLQDPLAAAAELTRAVADFGFRGAMINGFTNLGDIEVAEYLDEERVLPFWKQVNELKVPVYLHPRVPLPSQQRIYRGYPVLLGSAWGFGIETATHALRLILSGLFDRFPDLQIIMGHLGESLPYAASRLDHRLGFSRQENRGKQQLPISEYLRRNFYFTTSGFCRDQAALNALLEVGSDRLLFATDYPFEEMAPASQWLDRLPIAESDRQRIASTNARKILRLPGGV